MGNLAPLYFSGQGRLLIGDVYADQEGNKTGFRKVGNVPSLKISFETEELEHKESRTGNRLTDKKIEIGRTAETTFLLEQWNKENIAFALHGAQNAISGSSVADHVFTDASPVVGKVYPVGFSGLTAVTVEDSLAAALVEGTHYEVNAEHGSIEVLDMAAFTAPLQADFTYAAEDQIGIFNDTPDEVMLRFEGLNMADGGQAVIVALYKVKTKPLSELLLIQDEFAQYEIVGELLLDSNRSSSAVLGQFGRIILPA